MHFDREIYKYLQQTITKKALNYCDFTVCFILLYMSLQRQFDKTEARNTLSSCICGKKYLQNAWVVKDDIEFPIMNVLPLWMFGMLY